jgi:transposase-like protein
MTKENRRKLDRETEFEDEAELVDETKEEDSGSRVSRQQRRRKEREGEKLDPEMRGLIEQAADGYAKRMRSGEKIGLATVLEDVMSAIMRKEREIFLQEVPEDTSNGFYSRRLQLAIGKLNLKVPRVRISNAFRPALLPAKWKRVDKDYENLLVALLTNGYSQSQIERALHSLKLPYSKERLEDISGLVRERCEIYARSPLPESLFAVFIDAYHAKMRNDGESKIKDISIFTALGIDFDGYKSILGFWVVEGKENREFWADVFQDLVTRGLKKVLIFVTDDFPGVKELVRKLYPFADHQLCYIHMQRNLRRDLPKKVYSEIRSLLFTARHSSTREEGMKYFEQICSIIEKSGDKSYAQRLRGRAENYLAFLSYPDIVRKHIYTTNAVESINAGLEYIRRELGGYFPSRQSLDINYFIQIVNFNDTWMRLPIFVIASKSYELRQMFTMRFELRQEEQMQVTA